MGLALQRATAPTQLGLFRLAQAATSSTISDKVPVERQREHLFAENNCLLASPAAGMLLSLSLGASQLLRHGAFPTNNGNGRAVPQSFRYLFENSDKEGRMCLRSFLGACLGLQVSVPPVACSALRNQLEGIHLHCP